MVDDGSTDKTADTVRRLISENDNDDKRLSCYRNPVNRGKGYSVRRGMLEAKGEVVLFSDADLSTPIEELKKMLLCIDDGFDVVIGSRALPGSVIELYQPWYRVLLGKFFNLVVSIFVLNGFKDTQCGFKCFKKEAAFSIFKMQSIDGFAFDVESLLIANRLGFKIKEVPVRWKNAADSKVKILSGSVRVFIDLFKIKLLDWTSF